MMSTRLPLHTEDNGTVLETVEDLLHALDARYDAGDVVCGAAAYQLRMIAVEAPDLLDIDESELLHNPDEAEWCGSVTQYESD